MTDVYFYHLINSRAEQMLGALLRKCLASGWRVAVRLPDAAQAAQMDQALWLHPPESFLPHGLAGGPHDARQPVLLTTAGAGNDPTVWVSVGGADLTAEELRGKERGCIVFDGGDEAAVARARDQWRALTAAGLGAQYWSDASGGWEMRQRRPAADSQA